MFSSKIDYFYAIYLIYFNHVFFMLGNYTFYFFFSARELLRVHGALMWALGKTINCPEVPRVYVGSFWDQPYKNDVNRM